MVSAAAADESDELDELPDVEPLDEPPHAVRLRARHAESITDNNFFMFSSYRCLFTQTTFASSFLVRNIRSFHGEFAQTFSADSAILLSFFFV